MLIKTRLSLNNDDSDNDSFSSCDGDCDDSNGLFWTDFDNDGICVDYICNGDFDIADSSDLNLLSQCTEITGNLEITLAV